MSKTKTNYNPVKQWFFTYPKSGDLTKDEFYHSFPQTTYANLATETHQDGTFHIHAIMAFVKPVKKTAILEGLKARYPNDYKRIHVEPIRSLDHAITYTGKEDLHPLIIGDRPARGFKAGPTLKKIHQKLNDPFKYPDYEKKLMKALLECDFVFDQDSE